MAPPAQSMPSVRLQFAAPEGGGPQVPFVIPAATVQTPLQQSAFRVQTSPVCVQNEGGKQTPLKQSMPQHSALVVQAFPRTKHPVLSGVHVPFAQLPLQHSPLLPHAALSEVQGGTWHTPPTHVPEQQSPFVMHPAPSWRQPASRPPVLEVVVFVPVVMPPVPVALLVAAPPVPVALLVAAPAPLLALVVNAPVLPPVPIDPVLPV
jgi:hypothetical protein